MKFLSDLNRSENSFIYIVLAILFELAMGVVMFMKLGLDALLYLYALIPLLLLTAFLGTYAYNNDCDMRLYFALISLATTGISLQILVDQVYHPLTTFSFLKYGIGLCVAFVFVFFYYFFRKILSRKFTVYLTLIGCTAIYVILYLYGVDPNGYGTLAWIRMGPYTVQMTDFTKVAAILFYSSLLTSDENRSVSNILWISTLFFFINLAGSVIIHELGSFFILFFLHLSILFIFVPRSLGKRIYLIVVLGLCVGAVVGSFILYKSLLPMAEAGELSGLMRKAWPFIKKIYTRFSLTANLTSDPYGSGYQLLQGKKALWMSGLFGNTVNFHAIPVPESDMAFIALVNSFGLPLGVFSILMFMMILISGSTLSRNMLTKEPKDAIVIYGATILLFLQAIIVILGSCNMIPFAGLPIPFLSRGGTYQSIVFCFSGLLIYLSKGSWKGEAHEE
ncbi:MAG: FtsW/RodA/SpoVE family cell cycle protein [Solobacterium sp.]|nr:FtsW/RodA/SpoVE family cell cycle protein [Solobacterium sp.]